MKTKTIEVKLPNILDREFELVTEIGFYNNKAEFVIEAIKTLLSARRDLRIAIACKMYENKEISLGRACEIADVDIETFKKTLLKAGIKRVSDSNLDEIEDMAMKSLL